MHKNDHVLPLHQQPPGPLLGAIQALEVIDAHYGLASA
jgi:hypothetical protein